MPVFVLIIFLGAGLLWLLLSFVFIPLGKTVSRLWKNAKDAMFKDESKNETNKEINLP